MMKITWKNGLIAETEKAGKHRVEFTHGDGEYDYFRAADGTNPNRRIGIPVKYLAWLPGEGKPVEIPFSEIKKITL